MTAAQIKAIDDLICMKNQKWEKSLISPNDSLFYGSIYINLGSHYFNLIIDRNGNYYLNEAMVPERYADEDDLVWSDKPITLEEAIKLIKPHYKLAAFK